MENSWQIKCGSTMPSSSTPFVVPSSSLEARDQINKGYYSYPHFGPDLRSAVSGRVEDPLFCNSPNFSIHKPAREDLGNSFLALLSGPPSLLQCDFQEFAHPKLSGFSGKLLSNGGGVAGNAVGRDIPVISSGIPSENLSNQNLRNGADFFPVVSSRAVGSSNSSNSVFHDLQGSDLAKAVINHMVPGNQKANGSVLDREWYSKNPANTGYLSGINVQSSQRMRLEANCSISKQPSSFMSGCPRVFCLDTTGYLLLSNTGLLGIVCLCHSFHMSVAKFCEHSGLWNVHPGDVVHMDSGETIAQWRKLYFQKFRIRVPEDQSEWDWPEGLSVTAGFVKSRVTMPNLCKSSDMSSSGGFQGSEQLVDCVLFPKNHQTTTNSLVGAFPKKNLSNVQDVDNQMMECPVSRCSSMQKFVGSGLDNGCQSISACIDSIMKNGNSSISYSTLHNVRDCSKDSDVSRSEKAKDNVIVGRDAASSNIELRLGQPYQPSGTSGNSVLPVMGPQKFDHLNPPNSYFNRQMICNAANYGEEHYRQYHHCAADPFSSREEKEPSQSNLGNPAFGVGNAVDAVRLESYKTNVVKSSVVLPFADFSPPSEDGAHSKANSNMVRGSEHKICRALNHESHASEHEPFTVCWNSGNGLERLERQLNVSQLCSLGLTDKGKGVGCVDDVPYIATDAGFGSHKQVENSIFGGSSEHGFSAVNDKSCYSHQLSSMPPDASDVRNLFGYLEKVPCLGSSGHGDHVSHGSNLPLQGISMGFPLVTSTSTLGKTPAFLRQEGFGGSPYLVDENLRLLALRQVMDLSKQHHALSSTLNQEQGRYGNSYDVQHSLVDPSTSEEQSYRPTRTSKQDVPEAVMNLLQSNASFRRDDDTKKVPSMTGLCNYCNVSTFTPGVSSHPEGINVLYQLSDYPIQNEKCSLRLGRSDKDISRSSEHEICCQGNLYSQYQGQSGCEACTNHIGRKYDSTIGRSPNAFKEQMGTGSTEASMVFSSKYAVDHFLQKGTTTSLAQSGKVNGQLHKNVVCHAFQWRDVPSKVKGVCDAPVLDQSANVLHRREHDGNQLGDASAKQCNGMMQMPDPSKELEKSNVSSGCSAPAVTQASMEVNNMDLSTVDAGDTGYVSNHTADEGSGIDKCWSSDDAVGSERSAEFLGSTCRTNLRKEGSFHVLNDQASRSLLDELKLMDSLTWKKGRNQINHGHQTHTGLGVHGKRNPPKKDGSGLQMGKRKRAVKLKMLSAPCYPAGPSLIAGENARCNITGELPSSSSTDRQMLFPSCQGMSHASGACSIRRSSKRQLSSLSSAKTLSHKRAVGEGDYHTELTGDTDVCRHSEASSRKKLRKDFTSEAFRQFQMEELPHDQAEKTGKQNSVGCLRTSSSRQVNVCRKTRPVVFGKYGEISGGKDLSKPAKIVPMTRILKAARRCALPKSCKSRLTPLREPEKTDSTQITLCCAKFTDFKNEGGIGSDNVSVCNTMNGGGNCMEETENAWCIGDKQFANKLPILEKVRDDRSEKGHSILGMNFPAHLKLKCKEIRKRSIYELTVKGKKSSTKSCALMKITKCTPEMKMQKILKSAEDRKRGLCKVYSNKSMQKHRCLSITYSDAFCCVCGSSDQDDINCLLDCSRCTIRVHQACYGVSKVPKGHWYCRPCRTSSKDIVCVLCGYGGGAMTRALRSRTIVKSILKSWNFEIDCRHKKIFSAGSIKNEPSSLHSSGSELKRNLFPVLQPVFVKSSALELKNTEIQKQVGVQQDSLCCVSDLKIHNSITAGVLDSTVKQWVHMVCGLWTPGTRCPNVDTMTAFDVSGASHPKANGVCSMCNRPGGACIKCRVVNCSIQFHPWCAHQKGLLQSEVEGADNENVGFYGRCALHAAYPVSESDCDPLSSEIKGENDLNCARTKGYKGRKVDDPQCDLYGKSKGKGGCLVPQEQLNAWMHINAQKSCALGIPKLPSSDVEYDCRKEYARYKQAKGWKRLVVYKSGIHALGLYTSWFISRGEMVVEYVGEIVGLRVADKRENEYQSGRKLQYKSACYFFRIDKEHIIDATRKGGVARFVNHSCLPNCVAKVISVRNEKKVVFFAERDIYPGEEITYDYHFNHEDEGKKIPCFCNSRNCRRYLN